MRTYVSPSRSNTSVQRSARTESSSSPSSVTVTVCGPVPSPEDLPSIVVLDGRALVEAQELGRRHCCRPLPVLVDVPLVGGEAGRRDDAARPRVRRPTPDELDLDVVAAPGERGSREEQGGVPEEAHAAFVPGLC